MNLEQIVNNMLNGEPLHDSIIIGTIFSYQLIEIGILLLASILLFQLITLPVEFNASNRALKELETLSLVDKEEK